MTAIIEVIFVLFVLICIFLAGYCVGAIEEDDMAILDLEELMEYVNEWSNLTAEKHEEIEQKYEKKRKEYNKKHIIRRVFKL